MDAVNKVIVNLLINYSDETQLIFQIKLTFRPSLADNFPLYPELFALYALQQVKTKSLCIQRIPAKNTQHSFPHPN